jgi:hypothetical protein
MRAREFVGESKAKAISKRNSQATRGLNKFRDPNGYDRIYELNRVMMAVAATDGEIDPLVSQESWSGRFNTAHPYTKEEQKMLEKAYKAIGSEHHDLNNGDMLSKELEDTQKKSPVAPRPKLKFK